LAKKYVYNFFLFIVIIVFLAISFGCYRFLLRPKYDSINKEIKESIEARVENIDLLGRYLQRLNKYNENYENVPKLNKEKIETFFNYGYDQEILFSQFEAIAKNQGVILGSLSVQAEGASKNSRQKSDDIAKKTGGLTTVKINATFIGLDYKALKNFLAYMENILPLINIVNLKFADGNSVVIEAETYYFK
jgi:hypothetical protein